MKIYKKGTKVRFYWCANMVGTEDYEEEVLETDCTTEELDEIAREYMENNLRPESWFVSEDKDGFERESRW